MQCWTTEVFVLGGLQLRVYDRSQVAREEILVQCDLLRDLVLDMSNTAIGECMPFNFKFAKDLLQFGENVHDNVWFTCELQVVDVLGQDGD